jgi:c-di-GMP-binding flagellar brake protein YcgR
MTQMPPLHSAETTPSLHFSDMHLQPGDRLQIHCPTHPDRARHISRVVGFVDDASLIVTVPAPRGLRAEFIENEVVVVQAFSRNSAFAFKCTVLNVCRRPYDYMHLSFPDRIQGSVIRKATRVRVAIVAQATPSAGAPVEVTLGNLSATGALVVTPSHLGQAGDSVRLAFQVELHGVLSNIAAEATVLNVSGEEGAWQYGVEFRDLPAQERMILLSLIYQHMIENPRSLA